MLSSLTIIVGLCGVVFGAPEIDYAESSNVDQWLRHPVYGDPSFDSFERMPGNPIHRGKPPFEWPVNGSFFVDPIGGKWYIYVSNYVKGYIGPSRCTLYRSADRGKTWENLGTVLHGDPAMFDQNGGTPDVSVVFADGRYHMVYGWGALKNWMHGGLAYAWAEKPEGPFHRALSPITCNEELPALLGKYRRTYAGTLLRRKSDWLILGMMDAPPNSWAMFAMTSPKPEGPYTERKLLLNVEADQFLPALMEGFPAFVYEGYVYAPCTSVALNRNFQGVFRAPIERAAEPEAWEIFRHGSFWHSEDVEHETAGIWGQTPACWVNPDGMLWAMFNSRDPNGMGTVNVARRPWNQPLRTRGFVLTGHEGPSLTCLRQTFRSFRLEATLRVRGTARLFWDFHAPMGPDKPQSNATLHPLMQTRHQAVELSDMGWKVMSVDSQGHVTVLASGSVANSPLKWLISMRRKSDGDTTLAVNGQTLWTADAIQDANTAPGAIGLLADPHSHLCVDQFRIAGEPVEGGLTYLYTEALLGAGEKAEAWTERHDKSFRYGVGIVSKSDSAKVKWNVVGSRVTLWSPRGPEFGTVEVRLDGNRATKLDLYSKTVEPSRPVWTSETLSDKGHAVILHGMSGVFPVDCLTCTF